MKQVIIDTNFLMIPAQFKVDIFEEIDKLMDTNYELCILDNVEKELKHIIDTQKGKDKLSAVLALKLLKTKDLKVLASPQTKIRPKVGVKAPRKGFVDDIIVEITSDNPENWIVATQDTGLKKRLKNQKIKLIILRQKKYLKLV